jgi:hypothetical protein
MIQRSGILSITRLLHAIAAALVCACGETSTEPAESHWVRIEPSAAQYIAGDQVVVVLHNVGHLELRHNVCGSVLQRFEGNSWTTAHVSDVPCTDAIFGLEVGESDSGSAGYLPTPLAAGLYRYEVQELRFGSGELLPAVARASAPFLVGGNNLDLLRD